MSTRSFGGKLFADVAGVGILSSEKSLDFHPKTLSIVPANLLKT